MATYVDQRTTALADVISLIYPNGVGFINGQVHQDNELNQVNDYYANLVAYDGFSYRFVRVGNDNAANGAALQDAYDQAKLLTPGGGALSATNRVAILLPAGTYSFGTDVFPVDTEFIDFVGLGATPQDTVITSGHIVSDGQGTVTKSADDVAFANLTIHNSGNTLVNSDATDASAYAPQGFFTSELFVNVRFTVADYAAAWPTRLEQGYGGTYIDCFSGSTSQRTFEIATGIFTGVQTGDYAFTSATGTFTDCVAGTQSFYSLTGTATRCTGGNNSFFTMGATAVAKNCHCTGSGFGTTAVGALAENCTAAGGMFVFVGVLSGTHRNCHGGGPSFNNAALTGTFIDCSAPSGFGSSANTLLSGTFTRCTTTGVGFGVAATTTLSGTFTDCRCGGGFGGAGSTLSGTFTRCTSAGSFAYSFGSGASSILSGTFTDCVGVERAFGAGAASDLSGTFTGCIGGAESFGVGTGSTLSGAFTNCTAGSNSFGNLSSVLSGTFTNCKAINQSFGYGASSATPSQITGTFRYCSGQNDCFGNNTSIESTALFEYCTGNLRCFGQGNTALSSNGVAGTFRHCSASTSSFGNGMSSGKQVTGLFEHCIGGNGSFGSGDGIEASGTFRYCKAGNTSFGAHQAHSAGSAPIASGTFEFCIGGDGCFGASTGNEDGVSASGYFKGCVGGVGSFGSNSAGAGDAEASGTFIDCDGGYQSFSLQENSDGLMSGVMVNCRLLTNDAVTVTNTKSPVTGRMENCQVTVSETNASALLVGNGATIYGCALFGNGTGYAVTGGAATTAAIVQCRGSANGINTTNVTNSVFDPKNAFGVGKKTYKGILNQSGTAAPVVTVLENSLGGTVVWTRNSAGDYTGTLAAAFPITKTLITSTTYTDPSADAAVMVTSGGDGDTISCYMFDSGAPADSVASYTSVIVEVYP
jgi:hypothetical protein